jgi:hypothetical protein
MTHEIPKLTSKELAKFGFTTGAIVVCLFGLLLPFLLGLPLPKWPWVIAGVLWVWALILPKTLRVVYETWMKIGLALGWVNTRIILGLVFYLVVFPMGLVMRLLGKDPLSQRLDKKLTTYRVVSTKLPKEHMGRPF